jgi:capsular polysaccharide export protein
MAPPHHRGRAANWPLFVDAFLRRERITDLVLFGDCRPMHGGAPDGAAGGRACACVRGRLYPPQLADAGTRRGERQFQPAARSGLDPGRRARRAHAPALPPIGASLGRRVRNTWDYFRHMVWGAPFYPFYQSHRPGSIIMEGFGWVFTQLIRERTAARTARALERIAPGRYFLFPLQLTSDYQIRVHSPFSSMKQAADYVLASFAANALADVQLVIKEHPLDYASWAPGAITWPTAHARWGWAIG